MIERFRGPHFPLSNMYPLSVPIETEQGFLVPTSEHAYQAAKFVDFDAHRLVAAASAGQGDSRPWALGLASKERADRLIHDGEVLRPDWENIKAGLMHGIVLQKFLANPDLADYLVGTEGEKLVKGNNWGDRFWGVDPIGSQNGENRLGNILMQVREQLITTRTVR